MNGPRLKVLLVVALIAAVTVSCNLKIKMPTLGYAAHQSIAASMTDSTR